MDLSAYYEKEAEKFLRFLQQHEKQWQAERPNPPKQRTLSDRYFFGNRQTSFWIMPHPRDQYGKFHSHRFIEMVYVHRGSCTNRIQIDQKERTISLQQGDICILNTNAIHVIRDNKPENIIFNIMIQQSFIDSINMKLITNHQLDYELFLKAMQNKQKLDQYLVFHNQGESQCETIVQNLIYEFYESNECRDIMLNHLFTCLMVCLVRNFSQQIHNNEEKLNSQDISHMIQYISDHCDTVTINSLSEKFSYNPSYLSKLIKKQTGISFSDILLDARLKRAKNFLEDTTLSISDMIDQLGYSNRTYFNKQFKKRYQMTPNQYRKHFQDLKAQKNITK